ncbi:MAG: YfhO family protein [Saccharofermentans sp.]|nr:YfhO family protein [Saccharofermentans sp.]
MSRVSPCGDYSILISDLEAQYAPFLFMYRSMLLSAGSLKEMLYSFTLGMGKNMAGTFGYYLASPLNLLILLFKPEQTSEFVAFIVGLKMALSSAFMCLFIEKRSKGSSWSVLFGIMYAFSSFIMLYMFNIMWLDGYALLPLLLYFTEAFIESDRKAGLIATLLVLFLSNYYIAYMVGIYSFFYLLVRLYSEGAFADKKKAGRKVGRFILIAVLCAFTMCVILLPVGIDTLVNADPTAKEATENYVGFTFTGILDQIFLGTTEEFLTENLPYIFISVFVTFLCTLFFVSKATSKKEKKLYGILFAAVYFVFLINFFDVAWQVFDTPNWFFHREAFVFYPLFLIVAHKSLTKIKEVAFDEILKTGGILLVLLFAAQSFGEMKGREKIFLCNLCLVAAFTGIALLLRNDKWHEQLRDMPKLVPVITYILVTVEVVFFAPMMSAGRSTLSLNSCNAKEYSESIRAIEELAAQASDNPGFRMELEQISPNLKTNQIDDTGSYYANYRGVSLFNSNSNKSLHRFLKQFGYTVNYNYFTSGYTFASPDLDGFMSVGYTMTRSPYSVADELASDSWDNNLTLYRNSCVLPLAFPVDSGAFDFDFYSLETAEYEKDYLMFRNSWFNSMFPGAFEDDFFIPAEIPEPEFINCENIDVSLYMNSANDEETETEEISDSQKGFDSDALGIETEAAYREDLIKLYRMNSELPIIINYELDIESADELYLNVSSARCLSDCSIYVNGEFYTQWGANSFYSGVVRLGSYEVGDTVNVSIVSDSDCFSYIDVNFAYFDMNAFRDGFGNINTDSVSVTSVVNGHVELSTNLMDDSMILTTIPYEKGWTLTIDGQPAQIIVYQDALIGINPGQGQHEIVLDFSPPGIKTGAMISAVGAAGILLLCLFDMRKKMPVKTHGKKA